MLTKHWARAGTFLRLNLSSSIILFSLFPLSLFFLSVFAHSFFLSFFLALLSIIFFVFLSSSYSSLCFCIPLSLSLSRSLSPSLSSRVRAVKLVSYASDALSSILFFCFSGERCRWTGGHSFGSTLIAVWEHGPSLLSASPSFAHFFLFLRDAYFFFLSSLLLSFPCCSHHALM